MLIKVGKRNGANEYEVHKNDERIGWLTRERYAGSGTGSSDGTAGDQFCH